jgi:pimeloyl-ACP methyl ester carboxylesterase
VKGYRDRVFKSPAAELAVMADYDAVLAEWPVPYDVSVVPTGLGRTRVMSSGPESAPDLVLLHGAGTHAMSWVGDVEAFAERFRTHVVDIPGDPGRSDGIVADRRGHAYANWLGDVLDGLGIDRAHLTGISMGGWIAVRFAVTHPRRVRSLVLLTPAGVCQPRARFLLAALALCLFGSPGRRVVDHWIAGGRLDRRTLSYVDRLTNGLRMRIDIPPIISDADLRSLRMPVLAMVGDRDAIFAAHRVAGRIRRLVPQATVVIARGIGHALIGTAPYVVRHLSLPAPANR